MAAENSIVGMAAENLIVGMAAENSIVSMAAENEVLWTLQFAVLLQTITTYYTILFLAMFGGLITT